MKYTDPIEKFITENRGEFDSERPSNDTWKRIEKGLERTIPKWNPYKTAFWIVMVLAVAVLSLWYFSKKENTPSVDLVEYASNEEFLEAEDYYEKAINRQLIALRKSYTDASLEEDLSLLDQVESELWDEFSEAQGAYKEVVLNAIINNFQTKLSLLQKVLREMEEKEATNSIYHEM